MLQRYAVLILLVFLTAGAATGRETRIKEQELAEVRSRIDELRRSIADKSRRRTRIDRELQRAEAELVGVRARLTRMRESHSESKARIAALSMEIDKGNSALGQETEQLIRQLRSAYTSGRTERIRLLLNQQNPSDLGRMLSYYRYLNNWRRSNIVSIDQRLTELAELKRQEAETQQRLARLAREQDAELARGNEVRDEREQLLASLNREIDSEGGEIAKLKQQEVDLERLILELSSILADYPITSEEPFSELKGRLTWPVAGRLIHDFGQPRAENALQWNGVVLAAARGREVRSLYHGRVAFADWLPGLGLLIVIDHGESYLSLYGHNDTLLKNVGDWVAAGDVIATIGDSGGQAEPALYLEIRNGKKPLNPRRWISKTPRRQD